MTRIADAHREAHAFFDVSIDPTTRAYTSEDFTFCKRWRAMGGKIWADLTITLNHIGYFTFRGDATQLQPHL
jgi:hypothetical protein